MMKMRLASLVALVAMTGCSTALTPPGSQIQIVEDKEANACEFLSTVSAFDTLGASTGHESQNALNEARNKAAQAGGNAIKIVHMQTTIQGTSVTAEALKCEFPEHSQ